jgi:hypothetical protein
MVPDSKLLLRQRQGAANDFGLWSPLHSLKIVEGKRLGVSVSAGSGLDGL